MLAVDGGEGSRAFFLLMLHAMFPTILFAWFEKLENEAELAVVPLGESKIEDFEI